MTQKIVYLVQRYDMPLDALGIKGFPEYVLSLWKKLRSTALNKIQKIKALNIFVHVVVVMYIGVAGILNLLLWRLNHEKRILVGGCG